MKHRPMPSVMEPDHPFRIHPAVWLIATGLIAALLAIFVFKVALDTVITYGFLGLMLISHRFRHGGHGSHGDQTRPEGVPISASRTTLNQEDPASHSGGCH